MSQSQDLHRALLRPAIVHTLRAAGFHSTKPSVLDTLVNIAERHLHLLAATTAHHARASHNDPIPTVSDVRQALSDCGCLIPFTDAAEEGWRERLRAPLTELADDLPVVGNGGGNNGGGGGGGGGKLRMLAEKRKRNEEDVRDVREFAAWFDGAAWREIKRVAGMVPDAGTVPAVGVGGGVVQAEDFLTALKKKYGKGGDESRWAGTVLGATSVDERELTVEGGPDLKDWRPRAGAALAVKGDEDSLSTIDAAVR